MKAVRIDLQLTVHYFNKKYNEKEKVGAAHVFIIRENI